MNHQEAVLVVRKLAAYQPNQQFDKYTVDAWASELIRLDFADSMEAVSSLALAPRMPGQPFLIELRDIFAEVGRTRARRLSERRHLLPDPPSQLTGPEYREWLVATEGAACEPDWRAPNRPELPSRPMHQLLAGLGCDPDSAPADPDTIRAIRARKDAS